MDADAITIEQFCMANNICRATFYNLRKAGQAPAIMKVGSKVLISKEARVDWRRKMEEQSNKQAA